MRGEKLADLRDFFEVYIAPTEVCDADAAKLKDATAKLSVVLTQVRIQCLGDRFKTLGPSVRRDDDEGEELVDLRDFFEVYIAPTEVCDAAAKLKDAVAKLSVVLTRVRTRCLGGRFKTLGPSVRRDDDEGREIG